MSTKAVHNDAQVVFDLLMFGPIIFEFMTVWKQYLFNRLLLFVFLQATEHSRFSFSFLILSKQDKNCSQRAMMGKHPVTGSLVSLSCDVW